MNDRPCKHCNGTGIARLLRATGETQHIPRVGHDSLMIAVGRDPVAADELDPARRDHALALGLLEEIES